MFVKIRFVKDGQRYKTKEEYTVKEATQYYKEHFKNDDAVTSVSLIKFGTWHYSTVKVLKGKKIGGTNV